MKILIQELFYEIYKAVISSKYKSFLLLALFHGNKKRYEQTKIKFLGYEFIVPDTLSFIWQFKEIFVEEYYKFESKSSNPVIYDCGANIGTSCAYFKRNYPQARIIAFEANPKIAALLEKNLIRNNISGVTVIPKAVWVDSNGVEIGLENADGSSIHKNGDRVKVETVRLKDLLEREGSVDMLKMDIEGAELEVLADCRDSLSKVSNLFIEYHSFVNSKQNLSDLMNILESTGFRYFIKQPEDRSMPLINKINKSNPEMDLQVNIFSYRIS